MNTSDVQHPRGNSSTDAAAWLPPVTFNMGAQP